MKAYAHKPRANAYSSAFSPAHRGVLQRKSACDSLPSLAGTISERNQDCRQPEPTTADSSIPPIVEETLRTPGQPLGASTQRVMESRFGHDFSQVRVHTDGRAAASADAVDAHAYTVGSDIVFGAGQYDPERRAGRGLLAHELTHVVQQAMGSELSTSDDGRAEAEAAQNSRRISAGLDPGAITASAPGLLQREDKKKTSATLETSGEKKVKEKDGKETEEAKNKFSFKADFTVPVTDDLSFGSVSFLDSIKVSPKASKESESPISPTATDLELLETKIALTIAKLELNNLRDVGVPQGKLSFGTELSTFGKTKFSFGDSFGAEGSLGASLSAKGAASTKPLTTPGFGSLTLGTKGELSGTVAQGLGGEEKFKPKAEGKAGVEAKFTSKPSSALGFGGVLGKKGSFTAGAEAGVSGSLAPKETIGKVGGGVSLGVAGKDRFFKITVKGDVGANLVDGKVESTSRSLFLGATLGGKF